MMTNVDIHSPWRYSKNPNVSQWTAGEALISCPWALDPEVYEPEVNESQYLLIS